MYVDQTENKIDDEQVVKRINDFLATHSHPELTVAENLESAQSGIEAARTSDSLNLYLRDAEYYMKARWMIAERESAAAKGICTVGGLFLTAFYNVIKEVQQDYEWWTDSKVTAMRANKSNPNSPPGGFNWAQRGAADGRADNGQAKGVPKPAKIDPAWYRQVPSVR